MPMWPLQVGARARHAGGRARGALSRERESLPLVASRQRGGPLPRLLLEAATSCAQSPGLTRAGPRRRALTSAHWRGHICEEAQLTADTAANTSPHAVRPLTTRTIPLRAPRETSQMGKVKGPQTVKRAIDLLNSGDPKLRTQAARALGQIGGVKALKPLLRC